MDEWMGGWMDELKEGRKERRESREGKREEKENKNETFKAKSISTIQRIPHPRDD